MTHGLLSGTRLLTLTGPGGCGKTRLAIELASRTASEFEDGVHFVSLAAVRDPELVPTSIARGIGLQDARGRPLVEHLSDHLADRHLLLVLDNAEQVLDARDFVSDLLARTAAPTIVVTSRAPLHLSWEQEFPVPPLRVPAPEPAPSVASLAKCESVQLFAQRAAAAVPGFVVTEENVAAIAAIARRLDGLPLAIELAAARVKLFAPAAILPRLVHSLGLLVTGNRDVPDRHRTLRGTIAWSHDLLSGGAKRLLAVCSVFRGGIDLGVLEAVCAETGDLRVPVVDVVTELVDHSLLRPTSTSNDAASRFALLETVREFAAEKLAELSDHERVRAAHASAFCDLVKDLGPPPCSPDRSGLDRLELEHDNLRAALAWYGETEPATALRLANRLTSFWSLRGHFSEGRRRLGDLVDRVALEDPERVVGLNGAAWLATDQGDRAAALDALDESLRWARAAHDLAGEAAALYTRGRTRQVVGDPRGGRADVERALELQTAVGDDVGLAVALLMAGAAGYFEDDLRVAVERLEHCVQLSAALALPTLEARALQLLGLSRLELGDLHGARVALAEGVPAVVDLGDRFPVPVGLSALAGLAAKADRPRAALRLAGAAAEYEEVNQVHRPQKVRAALDAWLVPVRRKAGAAAQTLFDEGRGLTPDEAVASVLDDSPEEPSPAGPPSTLTPREREVAALVATGMTNREIAGRLYLSVRTVEVHVDHVLTKLGLRTRTRLAAWMHERGLPPGNT